MSVKLFYPEGRQINHNMALLSFNHSGSHSGQDAGRNSQIKANQFGLLAIAADRPGSGHTPRNPWLQRKLGRNYAESFLPLAPVITKICNDHEIDKLLIDGHSAGGAAALCYASVAAMRNIRIAGVVATEPAAFGIAGSNTPPERKAAHARLDSYLVEEKVRQKQDSELLVPPKSGVRGPAAIGRLVSMKICQINDFYNNELVFGSSAAHEAAENIAAGMPDTYMQIEFAEFSAVADQSIIDRVRTTLPLQRSSGSSARVRVHQPPHTTHASYNDQEFYNERLDLAIGHTLHS